MSKSSKAVKAGPLAPFEAGSSAAIEDTFDSKRCGFATKRVWSKSRRFATAQINSKDNALAKNLNQFEDAIKADFFSKCVSKRK